MTASLLLAQLFWVCESRLAWKHLPNPQCGLPRQVAIFQFVSECPQFQLVEDPAHLSCVKADVLSDAVLLFAPWPLFLSLADKSLGRKLTIIFSTCVVTTIVCSPRPVLNCAQHFTSCQASLTHASFILKDDDLRIPFSGIAEVIVRRCCRLGHVLIPCPLSRAV
jgi:hypothetical protein